MSAQVSSPNGSCTQNPTVTSALLNYQADPLAALNALDELRAAHPSYRSFIAAVKGCGGPSEATLSRLRKFIAIGELFHLPPESRPTLEHCNLLVKMSRESMLEAWTAALEFSDNRERLKALKAQQPSAHARAFELLSELRECLKSEGAGATALADKFGQELRSHLFSEATKQD